MTRQFPPGFLWGAATSAPQIEGAVDLDGREPSIWDTFAATPGHIRAGDTPSVACDHRHRWRGDVALMADLGLRAYRFSVAWPRRDLDYYRELVDAILGHGIEPVVTLYHWDLPQSVEDRGGWPVRDTAFRFVEHVERVVDALGDRVRQWTTINEPWCASMLGYASGRDAPGRTDPGAAVAAAHHLLLAHGLAVDVIRAACPDCEVGITLNPYPVVAASDRTEDLDAARRVDGLANRFWYDALLRGRYPPDVVEDLAAVTDLEFVEDHDLAQIAAPIDMLGVNYYRRHHVRFMPGASASGPAAMWPGSVHIELVEPAATHTDGGWAVEPLGLQETLVRVTHDYRAPPLYVHECGGAFDDRPDADAEVHDERRIAFLAAHIAAAHDAIQLGVDLRGFFVWSLLDNFEWAEGYAHRFGIIHVDFDRLTRTPKASARWFADVIARNGLA